MKERERERERMKARVRERERRWEEKVRSSKLLTTILIVLYVTQCATRTNAREEEGKDRTRKD